LPNTLFYYLGLFTGRLIMFTTADIPNFVNGVSRWFNELPGRISAALGSMAGQVARWFSQTQADATNHSAAAVNGATSWFNALPGAIGRAVEDMRNRAIGAFYALRDQAVNIARTSVDWVVAQFESLPGRISAAINRAISGAQAKVGDFLKNFNQGMHDAHVPGFALGTNFAPGGLTLVGENGPELVNLPRGSQVLNNRETNQTLSGGGGASVTINGGLHVHNEMDEQRLIRNLGWRLATA
jgi:hypothetical protein